MSALYRPTASIWRYMHCPNSARFGVVRHQSRVPMRGDDTLYSGTVAAATELFVGTAWPLASGHTRPLAMTLPRKAWQCGKIDPENPHHQRRFCGTSISLPLPPKICADANARLGRRHHEQSIVPMHNPRKSLLDWCRRRSSGPGRWNRLPVCALRRCRLI